MNTNLGCQSSNLFLKAICFVNTTVQSTLVSAKDLRRKFQFNGLFTRPISGHNFTLSSCTNATVNLLYVS
jgi:hypothetical protein